jgi:ABC-type antimicrobial peptide transport system permease subunit
MLILKERTKDIATLKVVGQGILSIGLSLVFEVFIISAIGSILGLALGFPVLMLVLSINKVQIVNYLYFISPLSYIYTFLIIFGTILVIGLLSLLKVKNINTHYHRQWMRFQG